MLKNKKNCQKKLHNDRDKLHTSESRDKEQEIEIAKGKTIEEIVELTDLTREEVESLKAPK